jgi:hypothetical protein
MRTLIQSKKTAAVIISITTILLLSGALLYFRPQETSPPKAAIIDELSSSRLTASSHYANETFITGAKTLLYTHFAKVDYYSDNATVDSYQSLSSMGYKLIVWRAHSALDTSGYIAISTSENNSTKDYEGQYSNGELTLCKISGDPKFYWAITPKFITETMTGKFEDTVIILMSCNGLKEGYTKTAEAFVEKGARVFISWDDWIETYNNDDATSLLLSYLISENNTIGQAVQKIPGQLSPLGSSQLRFFPTGNEAADYRVPDYTERTASNAWLDAMPNLRRTKTESSCCLDHNSA